MNRKEFYTALAANDGYPVKVVSRSGVEYWLCDGVGGLCDEHDDNPYVYGERVNPVKSIGWRKTPASNNTKWFYLRNVKLA